MVIPHGAILQAEAHSDYVQPSDVHSDGEYLHVPTVGGQCLLLCNYIFSNCIVKKISERSETTPHTHTH